ncbi:MAG: hypothetical protein ACLUDH_10010 [Faecalispora sporosphaeroides]|uniref:hypothetical protein n=1 Tax=Faecalispora sporosphaeroides TaxID=1549 RepID=UPI003992FC26
MANPKSKFCGTAQKRKPEEKQVFFSVFSGVRSSGNPAGAQKGRQPIDVSLYKTRFTLTQQAGENPASCIFAVFILRKIYNNYLKIQKKSIPITNMNYNFKNISYPP